ncbi:hypothetical protein KDL01_00825 [Actinospica durhamensis]|uniref:Uncharacterized protein n=1 Tax=Actinospica durhamensis TaxID=1508375 RepID=A0A941IKF6_9ACTN|nr:hypothetical protein [Actinospica durhamensis]MBR7831780.1 hypothetical protein [Actinospica durhamensis]
MNGQAASVSPRTVTTELAALATGVTEATIRKWASRGALTRYGSARKAEYDIDELREILARRSRSAATRSGARDRGPGDRV